MDIVTPHVARIRRKRAKFDAFVEIHQPVFTVSEMRQMRELGVMCKEAADGTVFVMWDKRVPRVTARKFDEYSHLLN